ncbi:hypothetical protein B484DRAFT_464646 [Ochromonadaceae sp. CCMP2298]|nr:hypothetical protein B484DRAFT_464646 [Ochromonadaceae sp. CCMP2298]
MQSNLKDGVQSVQSAFKSIAVRSIPVLGAALLLASPMESQAYSGHAGSAPSSYSYSASSSSSSSTRPNYHGSGYGDGGAGMPIPAMPMHTTIIISSDLDILVNVVLVAVGAVGTASGMVYVLVGFLNRREIEGSLGAGATVIRLRVALDSESEDTKAQLYFQQLAVAERLKIRYLADDPDIPPSRDSTAAKISRAVSWLNLQLPTQVGGTSSSSSATTSSSSTAVVSLVVMVRGDSQALRGMGMGVSVGMGGVGVGVGEEGMAAALQARAAEALVDPRITDNSYLSVYRNIACVDLRWAPERGGLSDRELLLHYPEMISI